MEQEITSIAQETILAKIPKLKFITLSPKANKELKDFHPFEVLTASMNALNTTTEPIAISGLYEEIYIQSIDLNDLLLENLKTAPITARIKVVTTHSGILQEYYQQSPPTVSNVAENHKKITEAYNNLVVQINEFYLEIPDNIAKELLRDTKNLSDTIPLPPSQ